MNKKIRDISTEFKQKKKEKEFKKAKPEIKSEL